MPRVQIDNPSCSFWLNVLAAAGMREKPDVPHVFKYLALQVIYTVVFLYTAEIIPRPLRDALTMTLASWQRVQGTHPIRVTHMPGRSFDDAQTDEQQAALAACFGMAMSIAIVRLLNQDGVPAALSAEATHLLGSAAGKQTGYMVADGALSDLLHLWGDGPFGTGSLPFTCKSAAKINISVIPRGSGLVASAYGMLCSRNAVLKLVAVWSAGPWQDRIFDLPDVFVKAKSMTELDEDTELPSRQVLRECKARYARNERLVVTRDIIEVNQVYWKCYIEEYSRAAQAHVPGGGRAIAISPTLSTKAWQAERFGTGVRDGRAQDTPGEPIKLSKRAAARLRPGGKLADLAPYVNAGPFPSLELALRPFDVELAV